MFVKSDETMEICTMYFKSGRGVAGEATSPSPLSRGGSHVVLSDNSPEITIARFRGGDGFSMAISYTAAEALL